MARPKASTVGISCYPTDLILLDGYAERRGISRSAALWELVRAQLAQQQPARPVRAPTRSVHTVQSDMEDLAG